LSAVTKLRPALSGARDFSLLRNVQTVSEAHPVSHSLGAVGFPPPPGEKGQGRESDHFSPSTVKVKNGWSYTSAVPISFHGVHRDFTFTR